MLFHSKFYLFLFVTFFREQIMELIIVYFKALYVNLETHQTQLIKSVILVEFFLNTKKLLNINFY